MVRALVVATLAVAALGTGAAPAAAYAPCQTGDVSCYQTCYLPHYEKSRGIYWVNC